jgi:predicted ATPase
MKNGKYVITGGPSCGKTTAIDLLQARGFHVCREEARHYIDTQRITGESVAEIKRNQVAFQHTVLALQVDAERALPSNEAVFLDRAIPDAAAYYRFLGMPEDDDLRDAMAFAAYETVFILDLLPLTKDYARTEDEQAQKEIHRLIGEVYGALPFPVIRVPVLPPQERVAFIVEHAEEH